MSTETTPAPSLQVSVGLPSGLDPEKVRVRKAALITAGTDPLLAEKLAIDAEQQQRAHDERQEAAAKAAKKADKKDKPETTWKEEGGE